MKNIVSLEAVHTHTHTHTHSINRYVNNKIKYNIQAQKSCMLVLKLFAFQFMKANNLCFNSQTN